MNNKVMKASLALIVCMALCFTFGISAGSFLGNNIKVNADIVVSPHESDIFLEESVSTSVSESTPDSSVSVSENESEPVSETPSESESQPESTPVSSEAESTSESVSEPESNSETESEPESEGVSEETSEETSETESETEDVPIEDTAAAGDTQDNKNDEPEEEAEYTVIGNIAIKKNAISDEISMYGIILIVSGVVGLILIIIWAVKSKNKKLDPEEELLKTVSEAGRKNTEAVKKSAPKKAVASTAAIASAQSERRAAARSAATPNPASQTARTTSQQGRTSAQPRTSGAASRAAGASAAAETQRRVSSNTSTVQRTPRPVSSVSPNSEAYRSAKAASSASATQNAKKASKYDTQDLLNEFLKK